MGQRANLIIGRAGDFELFYSHWHANQLDNDLFWGPRHAEKLIRTQRSEEEGAYWLDEIWAEGGAVLDAHNKRLLWWGGEDVLFDIPWRRLFLAVMAEVWRGWSIEWAYEGVIDLADTLCVPRSRVLNESITDNHGVSTLDPPGEPDWTDHVLSIRHSDGTLSFYPGAGKVERGLADLDELLRRAQRSPCLEEIDLSQGHWRSEDFPASGAHLEEANKVIRIWTAHSWPLFTERLESSNPGWTIQWERDRYETQLDSTEGRLVFPERSNEEILGQIREGLLRRERNQTNRVMELASRIAPGQDVSINPFALRDDTVTVNRASKATIFDQAVAAWLSGRN